MQQAEDFREECNHLAALLEPLDDDGFARPTQFKGWSIDDVLGHLHLFNVAAELTLTDEPAFQELYGQVAAELQAGKSLVEAQVGWLDGLAGRRLFEDWRAAGARLADAYADADPRRRVAWVGPDMSARSCLSSRQMETWAHGQAVFDLLGAERIESDRLRNVAHLGVTTFGWSFTIRGEPVPETPPHVRLTAPSGAVWEWHAPEDGTGGGREGGGDLVSGSAVGFCQVVAQTRNVADTDIETRGATAARWMAIAQCFAGAPIDPPAPGARFKAR